MFLEEFTSPYKTVFTEIRQKLGYGFILAKEAKLRFLCKLFEPLACRQRDMFFSAVAVDFEESFFFVRSFSPDIFMSSIVKIIGN